MRNSITNYVVITNAEMGYGKELAISLAKRGHIVLITTKDDVTGDKLADEIRYKARSKQVMYHPLDLSDQKSIRKFVTDYRYNVKKLDFLVFNDSIDYLTAKKQQFTTDDIERNWATYHMGPVILTGLLLALLKESSDGRIVIPIPRNALVNRHLKVNMEDPEFRNSSYNTVKAYHQAKLAQIFFMSYLAEHIKDTGIFIGGVISPQLKIPRSQLKKVSLGIRMNNRFSKSPGRTKNAVMGTLTASKKRLKPGMVLAKNRKPLHLNPYLRDEEICEQLMTLTRKYIIS